MTTTILIVCCVVLFAALLASLWFATKARRTPEPAPAAIETPPPKPKRPRPPPVEIELTSGPIPSRQVRQHIRAMRMARGWSQRAMADRLGILPSSVANIERTLPGTWDIAASTLRALATAFGEPLLVAYEPTTITTASRYTDLRDAISSALTDSLSGPPLVSSGDDGTCDVLLTLLNDETLTYTLPQDEPLDKTVANVVALAANLMANPYAD